MDPVTLNILITAVISIVGGYLARWAQTRNNPAAPLNPLTPAPAEPKIGEGLIIKLLLDALRGAHATPPEPAPSPTGPVDLNELLKLLQKLLQTPPPTTPS